MSLESPSSQGESFLRDPDVREFIHSRAIRAVDFPLLEEIGQLNKEDIIMGLHNFYSGKNREQAISSLEKSMELAVLPGQKEAYRLFLDLTERYDEYAARHLVAVMERRGRSH